MTTEKEITFTELKGKFTKDFDTFGKMDPFLELTAGKNFGKTETHDGGGKEPSWKTNVTLCYFDENFIIVKAYDEDGTQNQYIGAGKIETKSLKASGGNVQVTILTQNGENVGTVSAKYSIKNLPASPLLLIKSVRCDFLKEVSYILKTKPYIKISSEQGSIASEAKEDGKGLTLTWTENLRVRIKQSGKIVFGLYDKNDSKSYIFEYEAWTKEFRYQNGTKKFYVYDKDYLSLGSIEIDFETVNLVSKQQSAKNIEKDKKSQGQLTSISLSKINGDLIKLNKDIYLKIIAGSNTLTTDVLKNAPKDFVLQAKSVLYVENGESKINVVLYQKKLLKDEALGFGTLSLQNITGGDKKISLANLESKQDIGSIILSLSVKQVPAKILTLTNVTVAFVEGGDLIGQSEPYIAGKIGGWSSRTQTGDGNRCTYKKKLELKYADEDTLILQVWDQDVSNDEIIYTQKLKLSDLKGQKGDFSINLTKTEDSKTLKKGTISFKYESKINSPPIQSVQKPSQKKIESTKEIKQPIETTKQDNLKKQEIPKEETKKQIVKQQTKRQNKNEQGKKEQVKKQILKNEIKKQTPREQIKQQVIQRKETEKLDTNKSNNNNLNKDSLSKSRGTLYLPSIVNSNLNYGDKIFDKQSAATLQKSILVYSVPKANRFAYEPKYSGEPSYCIDSCFKANSMKGAGFGFGRKRQFPEWLEKNMKQIPPPGAYFEGGNDLRPKGPTFGISHKHYEKVMIPKQMKTSSQQARKLSPIKDTISK